MARVDSGIDDSIHEHLRPRASVEKSDAHTSRHRKSSNPNTNNHATYIKEERPSPEEKPLKKNTQSRRQSMASSSEGSTNKTRKRGQSSKHSSRRTSATLVDPTRPARQYRVRSSHTIPTASRDVDDVLALHFRSCSLFQNPSYSSSPRPPMPGTSTSEMGVRTLQASTVSASTPAMDFDLSGTQQSKSLATEPAHSPSGYQAHAGEATPSSLGNQNIIIHWNSVSTRKREYEQIDRSNRGLRGLVRRITPRRLSGPPTARFYDEDASDTCSVRRYRLELPEEDDGDEADEKSMKALKGHGVRQEKRKAAKSMKEEPRAWHCF